MRRRLFVASAVGSTLGALGVLLVAGSVRRALAEPPREGFPPDPPPKANKKHWVFEVLVRQGVPSLGTVTKVELKKAEATPRVMGRYALELYVGTELLDRLRFNVPLGGDGPREGDDQPGRKRPKFRANTRMFVRVADHARASRLRLVDRATGEVEVFFWPPEASGKLRKEQPDGGVTDGGSSPDAGDGGAKDGGTKDGGTKDGGKHDPEAP